jgi:hypothetical protein
VKWVYDFEIEGKVFLGVLVVLVEGVGSELLRARSLQNQQLFDFLFEPLFESTP